MFAENRKNPDLKYEWLDVGVLDYNPQSSLWLVQKVDSNGRLLDDRDNPININHIKSKMFKLISVMNKIKSF